LGLSQVYGFVRQSGGFVTIESSPGGGTTVSIYLPRSEMTPDAQAPRAEISVGDAGRGQTILVVEDDEDVRAYIVETLRDLGYDTMEAGDAEAAIELFKRSHVDLLLTDVVMPGKNGRVLSNELLAIRPTLKVLFMSGYSRDAILQDGRLERGLELLQKPVTREALARKLQSMLGSTEPRLVRKD
jgi:two-component system NtrC family sensor kinase